MNGTKPLSIGQGVNCDIQLPDSDLYEPQVFASVLYSESGDGWLIIRRSDCCHIMINGKELTIAQSLGNGDVISFLDDAVEQQADSHADADPKQRIHGTYFTNPSTLVIGMVK